MRRILEVLAILSVLILALGLVAFCIYSPVTFMVITLTASGCLFTYSVVQAFTNNEDN